MADLAARFARDGFVVFDADPGVARWATQAHTAARQVVADPALRAQWLRHGDTWFVGVDVLPNEPDGLGGVPLRGPWDMLIEPPDVWHRAQVSVVYPGYPRQDREESDAAHRFRITRCAAHVDGLHLEAGRRILREPHAFVLGVPLNDSDAAPLVVWPGSHLLMQSALAAEGDLRIGSDVTQAYKTARAACLEANPPVSIAMRPGQSVLLHRLLVHGVAPWGQGVHAPKEGRMVAYFRPELSDPGLWLRG